MPSKKSRGGRQMESFLHIRVPEELNLALEEAKWNLRKSVSELVRDAVSEYLDNHLTGEAKRKVRNILK